MTISFFVPWRLPDVCCTVVKKTLIAALFVQPDGKDVSFLSFVLPEKVIIGLAGHWPVHWPSGKELHVVEDDCASD